MQHVSTGRCDYAEYAPVSVITKMLEEEEVVVVVVRNSGPFAVTLCTDFSAITLDEQPSAAHAGGWADQRHNHRQLEVPQTPLFLP